jgi:hypothetical protein
MMNDDDCATSLLPALDAHAIYIQYYNALLYNPKMFQDINAIYATFQNLTTPKSSDPKKGNQASALVGYLVFNLNPASCNAKNIGPLLSNSSSGLSS